MEFSNMKNPTGKSPRRSLELQGPRPTPLKINKESHKIKKPPLAPHQPHPPRQPIIIYTVSPKIIHTTPSDFMSLVQRLTGSHSSSSQNEDPFSVANGSDESVVSPAARFATIEKAARSSSPKNNTNNNKLHHPSNGEGREISNNDITISMSQHGILSPGPTSLSPIPSGFFSPTAEAGVVSVFHDLSPVLHGSKNFVEGGGFMIPSPSNYFVSPRTIDLFNTLFN